MHALLITSLLALQPGRPGVDGPWNDQIQFATSTDGLTFSEPVDPIRQRGSAPDIVELTSDLPGPKAGKGNLVVYFVDAGTMRKAAQEGVSRIVSSDQGKTWSEPEPIEIRGRPERGVALGPSVLQHSDGRLRLYFYLSESPDDPWRPPAPKPEEPTVPTNPTLPNPPGIPKRPGVPEPTSIPRDTGGHRILSAVSADGLAFDLEAGVRFKELLVTDPEVVIAGGEFLMFLSRGEEVILARSADGLDFRKDDRFLLGGGGMPGAMVLDDGTVRVYQSAPTGIASTIFDPKLGTRRTEGGIRFKGPCADPAVWELAAGGHVAVLRRPMDDRIAPPPGPGSPR